MRPNQILFVAMLAMVAAVITTPVGMTVLVITTTVVYWVISWLNGHILDPVWLFPIGFALYFLTSLVAYLVARRMAKK